MLQMNSRMVVADNTGAKTVAMIRRLGQLSRTAQVGDIIVGSVKESTPEASVKKGSVVRAVIVRTKNAIAREDGSYLRLKTLSLSYNVPRTWLEKIGINSLQLYATAENLFTITRYKGYDPEVNASDYQGDPVVSGIDFGTYPQTRAFIFGVNLEF